MSSNEKSWFVQVPKELFHDETIKPTVIKVYGVIRSFQNVKTKVCCPSVQTIAAVMNCSERTVRDSIKVLVDRGYVSRYKHFFKFLK